MTTPEKKYIPMAGGNNGALTSMTSSYSSSLPLMLIITDGDITHDHTPKTGALVYTIDNPVTKLKPTPNLLTAFKTATPAVTPLSSGWNAEMRIRGQSTGGEPKAQYTFKLENKPDKGNFLSMPEGGKHWVFNDIGVQDWSLMRDPLAFHIQRQLGQWAPRHKYFQLFVYQKSTSNTKTNQEILTEVANSPNLATGGFYRGIYLMLEKIRAEKSRIDINLKKKKSVKNGTVGGVVLQINPGSNEYESLAAIPGFGTEPTNLYEPKTDYFSKSGLSSTEKAKRAAYLTNIKLWWSNLAKQTNGDYTTTLDHQSFAVYFLCNELANDPDGYHKSTFMYKSESSDKLYAGPLWDKDKSFGNPNNSMNQTKWNYTRGNPPFWSALIADKSFCSTANNLWFNNIGTGKALDIAALKSFIDEQQTLLKNSGAVKLEGLLWGTPSSTKVWDAQVTDLKNALDARMTWINSEIQTLLDIKLDTTKVTVNLF